MAPGSMLRLSDVAVARAAPVIFPLGIERDKFRFSRWRWLAAGLSLLTSTLMLTVAESVVIAGVVT